MQWWNKYRVAILSGLMIAIVLAIGFTRINGETLPPLHAEYLGQPQQPTRSDPASPSVRSTPLDNPDNVPGDYFGNGMAISADGTIALIGAYSDDVAFVNSGAVYYYRRDRSGWKLLQRLMPALGEPTYWNFGVQVALNAAGDVAVITSVNVEGFHESAPPGSVFVFARVGDTWTQTHRLRPPHASATFATDATINANGDTILIGEPLGFYGDTSGRAHIYVRNGNNWEYQALLLADEAGNRDYLGTSVALRSDGNMAFVRGSFYNHPANVYVYTRSGSTWTLLQVLKGSDRAGDFFGSFMSLSGDGMYFLSSSLYTSADLNAYGVGLLYTFEQNRWQLSHIFQSLPEDKTGREFSWGSALSGDGKRVIMGSRVIYQPPGFEIAPLIYIFDLKSTGWELTHKLESPRSGDNQLNPGALDTTGTTFLGLGASYATGIIDSVVYEVTDRDDNLILNGDFSAGMQYWGTWGAPTQSAIQHRITNGTFEFYRQSGSQQAVVLQNTGVSLTGGTALEASFLLGNTSSVRKRVSVLLHDADFSDSQICSFWIPPVSPLRRYGISTFTSDAWTSAMFSVYASTADSTGWLQLDNVNMHTSSSLQSDRTLCFDAVLAAPTSIPTTTNVPGTVTHTPTTTLVPSECSSLSLSTGVNFVGTNQVQLIINNSFLTPVYLHRVDFRWPTLSAYPNMALSAIALGSAYVWAGTDTTPPTVVGGAPTASDGNFASGVNLSIAAGTASSSTATALTFIFSNSPLPISNALSPSSFNGTVITIRYGETFCNLPLNTNGTSTPTPTALLSTLNPTPTPTNTLPSSGPCGEDC
jgi:hypothetical protein